MNKFSDFAKNEHLLTGKKTTIAKILGKTIIVKDYRIFTSSFSSNTQCLDLQFEYDGEEFIIFTNSKVLIRQIEQYSSMLPFETVIAKIAKYYTFT